MSKLAIVIPYYKIKYFKQTLESLKHQTHKDFSIYIGNDASPDPVNHLITKYKPFLNITYKEFSHIGYKQLSKHWSRCINMTKGEPWIQVLGDDDVLAPNFVETIHAIITQKHPKGFDVIRVCRKEINQYNESIKTTCLKEKYAGFLDSKAVYIQKIRGAKAMTLSEQVFSKKAYQAIGFQNIPVAYGSDNISFLEFSNLNEFYYTSKTYVKIRKSPEHLSSTTQKDIKNSRIDGLKISRKYVLKQYATQFNKKEQLQMLWNVCKIENRIVHIPYHLGIQVPLLIGNVIFQNIKAQK